MRSPSSTPSLNHEAPKSSKFRMAIAFILALGAGIGIGKCVYDRKDADSAGKPDIEDVGTERSIGKRQELTLSQCQTQLLLGIANKQCRDLSEEEVQRRYLEREKARLEKRAADIIDKLGIANGSDQDKIFEAVLNGCSEIDGQAGKTLELSEPSTSSDKCGPVDLTESIGVNWLDLSPEDYNNLSDEDKKRVDLFRDKKETELLQDIDFNDDKAGIGKMKQINEFMMGTDPIKSVDHFIDAMQVARDKILKTESQDEKKAIACKLTDELKKLHGTNGIFVLGMSALRTNIILRSIYSLAGITDYDPYDNPPECGTSKETQKESQ